MRINTLSFLAGLVGWVGYDVVKGNPIYPNILLGVVWCLFLAVVWELLFRQED